MVALHDTNNISGGSEEGAAAAPFGLEAPPSFISESRPHILFLSFMASFTVAALIAVMVGHIVLKTPLAIWPLRAINDGGDSSAALIHKVGKHNQTSLPFEPFLVKRSGDYLKVDLAQLADPTPGEDLVIFLWFKLKRPLAVGESASLLGKFDAQSAGRPGYALALEGAPDGIRPRVYLSNGSQSARWYSFSTYQINRRDWYLIDLKISQDTFVSASLTRCVLEDRGGGEGRFVASEAPVLLGGHRISEGGLPSSKVAMVIGAFGAGRFRGELGPFGVVSGVDIAKTINGDLISRMIVKPGAAPQELGLSSKVVRVWGAPLSDIGPRRVVIKRGEELNIGKAAPVVQPRGVKKGLVKVGPANNGANGAKGIKASKVSAK
jgi:hypothetical protein